MGVTPGAVFWFDAARALYGREPGSNSPLTTPARDCSGSGNDGTLTNFAGTTSSGYAGSGTPADPYRLVFDGTNDEVGVADDPALKFGAGGAFTLEAWVTPPDSSANSYAGASSHHVIGKQTSSSPWNGYALGLAGNRFYVMAHGGYTVGERVAFSSVYTPGTRYHVVGVYDGSECYLYVDGALDVASRTGTAAAYDTDTTTPLVLGHKHPSAAKWAAIQLMSARVYPSALSVNELATNYAAGPAIPAAGQRTMQPSFTVTVAGQDVTDLVDYESCVDIDSERGEASATVEIPVGDENEVPINGIAQDAEVIIDRGGRTPWTGHIVRIQKPTEDNLRWELGCAGGWAELTKSAAWCRAFVAVPYAEITEMRPDQYSIIAAIKVQDAFTLNTDGQVHFVLPKGSRIKDGQGKVAYYWPFNGACTLNLSDVGENLRIARVTGKWTCAGNDAFSVTIAALGGAADPFNATTVTALETVSSSSGSSGTFDTNAEATDLLAGDWASCLGFYCEVGSDVSETTQENSVQLTELVVYFDRTTAPTIDEIVVEIDAEARPDGETASSETIGDAQTPFVCEPFMTPADGIGQALAKVATPPLCGVWQNRMTIKNRPSAPDGTSKLWIVSEQLTPGLEWGVEIDEEQSVDYVACVCSLMGDATYPDGTQFVYGYPSFAFDPATDRVGLVDAGEHSDPALYAQQAYRWLHRLPQGPVVVPYVVHDDKGVEWPAEAIRAWDWVQNVGLLDDELAGPHLISDVQRQGGIATLTIGNTAAYQYTGPERLDQKGKYTSAHWQRTNRKEWAKGKKKPKGGRWKKAKNGKWWRWKLRWVEGRYS
jgi:hypothetical protein